MQIKLRGKSPENGPCMWENIPWGSYSCNKEMGGLELYLCFSVMTEL